MNAQLLNAINMEDMGEIASLMIEPQRHFAGDSTPYVVDMDKDAINMERLTVRTDIWMKNLLEQDEFSKMVNRILRVLSAESDTYLWDYQITEYLDSLGIELDDVESGYTYNHSDYCRLDRNIHYSTFKYDGESYIIFAVHHGADARVGFGMNACFKVQNDEYLFLAMEITGHLDNEDYECGSIEDVATYDKEKDEWIHNESGKEINVYSSANGW
jgi:hypothetical protein